MSRFTAVNLSALPLPAVIETLSFEAILADMKADLIRLMPALEPVLALESDPLCKVMEVFAYRELMVRAGDNDKLRGVYLPTAVGADLDNLVSIFGVQRLTVIPADPASTPPTAAVMESDAALRLRAQLALDGYSTAGSRASYEYHARSASAQVADVVVDSPAPGDVRVVILAAGGSGAASAGLIATVHAALTAEEVRPLCDAVNVISAGIVTFTITAQLTVQDGPVPAAVLAAAQAEVARYLEEVRGIGRSVRRSAIFAALHRPGVEAVTLIEPASDVEIAATEAAHCLRAHVTLGGAA